jgi:hypothetical protein
MFKCIIAGFRLALFFFLLPHSLSCGGFKSLKILYSFQCREYMNRIHHLTLLLLPSLSHIWPPLGLTCFSYYCWICIRSNFHISEQTGSFWHFEPD